MRRRNDRWLKLIDVAELLKLPHKSRKERRQYAWRLLRQVEKRDGAKYLKRFGAGKTSPLWVSVSALERLMPRDAATMAALRSDVDEIGGRVRRAERRIDGHDSELAKHREWHRKILALMAELPTPGN